MSTEFISLGITKNGSPSPLLYKSALLLNTTYFNLAAIYILPPLKKLNLHN